MMSEALVKWLGGNDTGASSKAIALTALGVMPQRAPTSYPHDEDDFGRCHRLLQLAPEARAGLDKLGAEGGPYWKALHAAWADLTAAYVAKDDKFYERIQALLRPIEAKDSSYVRLGNGVGVRFGA
jgi:hypothetical protein